MLPPARYFLNLEEPPGNIFPFFFPKEDPFKTTHSGQICEITPHEIPHQMQNKSSRGKFTLIFKIVYMPNNFWK